MNFKEYIILAEVLENKNPSMNIFLTEGVIEILKRIVHTIKRKFNEFLNTTFKEKADKKFLEDNSKLAALFIKLAEIEYTTEGNINNVRLRPLPTEDFIRTYISLWREFKKLDIDMDFPKIELSPTDMIAPPVKQIVKELK